MTRMVINRYSLVEYMAGQAAEKDEDGAFIARIPTTHPALPIQVGLKMDEISLWTIEDQDVPDSPSTITLKIVPTGLNFETDGSQETYLNSVLEWHFFWKNA